MLEDTYSLDFPHSIETTPSRAPAATAAPGECVRAGIVLDANQVDRWCVAVRHSLHIAEGD
jgi:hypothetical protein